MNTTVTGIQLGFSNTARFPYALAKLACGHLGHVRLVPRLYACAKCGGEVAQEEDDNSVKYCCGTSHFHFKKLPNAHDEADRVTKVGDAFECVECDRDAEQTAWLKNPANLAGIHHTRARYNSIYLYRLDPTSPSGFMLVRGVSATKEHEALLRGSLSPLSPTERA